jgi:hypothetical protein
VVEVAEVEPAPLPEDGAPSDELAATVAREVVDPPPLALDEGAAETGLLKQADAKRPSRAVAMTVPGLSMSPPALWRALPAGRERASNISLRCSA